MSSNRNECSKFNSNLPVGCNLFKFLAKGLSPLSAQKIILLQSCKNKRDIHSKRRVLNAYDRRLIFILTTFGNFFDLLKKSFKTYVSTLSSNKAESVAEFSLEVFVFLANLSFLNSNY